MSDPRSGNAATAGRDVEVVKEESEMADFVGGIKQIGPTYPVKPVQPTQKDRETGKRRNQRQEPEAEKHDDDETKPTIDEHV